MIATQCQSSGPQHLQDLGTFRSSNFPANTLGDHLMVACNGSLGLLDISKVLTLLVECT